MNDKASRSIRLYDLVLDNGCTLSPFVWRIKYAIAHKGFNIDAVPVRSGEIETLLEGKYDELPVIDDNGVIVADSWAIAEHIERSYMDRPLLFRTCGEHVWARFFDRWLFRSVVPHLFRQEDRIYLRNSRELRFVANSNFDFAAEGWNEQAPTALAALEPLRTLLKETPWLGGIRPNYVDFCGLSVFLWAAAVDSLPPVDPSDALYDWLNRGFDLYDGIGRDPRLAALPPKNSEAPSAPLSASA